MGLSKSGRRYAAIALAAAVLLPTVSACGDDAGDDGKIVLNVDVFGDQGFGYDELYKKYMNDHPDIKIKERGRGVGLNDYTTRLTQYISSGTGAGDVVALEEGTIVQFKAQAGNFVDLKDYGAASLEQNFLPWKWKQGQTGDGKQLIGLGTDVGGMAICYRKDLFAKAGLPTDREKVGELWPTWDKFIETGKTYAAAEKATKFVDASTNFFNVVLMQVAGEGSGYTYFNTDNKFAINDNKDVKKAWDLTVNMVDADLSAGLRSFSDPWNAGFKAGSFATIACPAWMTGTIEAQAGADAKEKWDIAKAPGSGGNWGGSFLAVPKQSKHPKEAAELAKYLTGAEGQVEAFNKIGALPSNPQALDDPAVVNKTNAYFNNAPTGAMFAAGAKSLKPVYLGVKNQAVRDEVENALRSVEQKQRTADAAWQEAVKNATNAAK
jgi:cellobiose transport system substrate-binding protein